MGTGVVSMDTGVVTMGTGVVAIGAGIMGVADGLWQSGSVLSMSLSPSSSLLLKQISLGPGVGSIKGGLISQIVIESKRMSAFGLSRV